VHPPAHVSTWTAPSAQRNALALSDVHWSTLAPLAMSSHFAAPLMLAMYDGQSQSPGSRWLFDPP
jgi:hypothetical protein